MYDDEHDEIDAAKNHVQGIVVDGERYKVVESKEGRPCDICDLRDFCDEHDEVFSKFCERFLEYTQCFKKEEKTK